MATSDVPTISPADVLVALNEAQRELAAWAAHVAAYAEQGEPGQALQAERVAGIVTASLEAAACDSRAMARDAVDRALI
jgi:hypothetical protein